MKITIDITNDEMISSLHKQQCYICPTDVKPLQSLDRKIYEAFVEALNLESWEDLEELLLKQTPAK